MSKTYTTAQGDMWDSIAYQQLGSVAYTHQLLLLNQQYHDIYIFPAGVVLTLPDVDATTDTAAAALPPWKQVAG